MKHLSVTRSRVVGLTTPLAGTVLAGALLLAAPAAHAELAAGSASPVVRLTGAAPACKDAYQAPKGFLPEKLCVYVHGDTVANAPMPGFEQRVLPTVNRYRGKDGGYLAMYTNDASKGVYAVSSGGGVAYVVGQVRVKGHYEGRVFQPAGYENQDLSKVQKFKDLCRELFGVDGWAGGDTGCWFGIE